MNMNSRKKKIFCFAFTAIMSSQKLQDLFYMVLMAGNFLNNVSARATPCRMTFYANFHPPFLKQAAAYSIAITIYRAGMPEMRRE